MIFWTPSNRHCTCMYVCMRCVYTHVCMRVTYTYMQTCIHTNSRVYIDVYPHTCIYEYVHRGAYTNICIYMHIFAYAHVYIRAYHTCIGRHTGESARCQKLQECICACVHIYIHIRTRFMHMRTHTYRHTYTYACVWNIQIYLHTYLRTTSYQSLRESMHIDILVYMEFNCI
jgi:hypothetical protein